MNEELLYADPLIQIAPDSIRLFGFLTGKKSIPFSRITRIKVLKPTVWNGKYRYMGSSNFRTWFPDDGRRSSRDAIFIITMKNRWFRLGFTVEDSAKVKAILREKVTLIDTTPATSAVSADGQTPAETHPPVKKKGLSWRFWLVMLGVVLPWMFFIYAALAFSGKLPHFYYVVVGSCCVVNTLIILLIIKRLPRR